MSGDERLARILSASPELGAFTRWMAGQRRGGDKRDYLFLEGRPRFEPRRDDVAVAAPGVSVTKKGQDAVVMLASPGAPPASILIPGVPPRSAEALLGALDGARTLLEARWKAGLASDVAGKILRATFGLVVFAPRAVEDLEARVSGVEIVRFPTSPYAIERAYWDNAADLRDRATAQRAELVGDVATFMHLLRELHVLQILGAGLDRFYRPSSPATDDGVDPGCLHLPASRLLERGDQPAVFLDGLRVLAPDVGGRRSFALLATSVDDPGAARAGGSAKEIVDDGIPWGRLVTARGDGDETAKLWFIPPRPLRDEHWAALAAALRDAHAATDRHAVIAAAARFHARFVRLHPFRCANQSLAMSLVNDVVARVAGSGIPHLALDHLALRLTPQAYERAFARAVDSYAVDASSPAARLATVRERSRAALALCDALERCGTDDEVRAALEARPDAAGWALLTEPRPANPSGSGT